MTWSGIYPYSAIHRIPLPPFFPAHRKVVFVVDTNCWLGHEDLIRRIEHELPLRAIPKVGERRCAQLASWV